jgi:hypothetical protein
MASGHRCPTRDDHAPAVDLIDVAPSDGRSTAKLAYRQRIFPPE